jgi:hypothetical protein
LLFVAVDDVDDDDEEEEEEDDEDDELDVGPPMPAPLATDVTV